MQIGLSTLVANLKSAWPARRSACCRFNIERFVENEEVIGYVIVDLDKIAFWALSLAQTNPDV